MAEKKRVKVTLLKSTSGRLKNHKSCVAGLGLRRIGSTAVLEDTPSIRGMINKVHYLVRAEEV